MFAKMEMFQDAIRREAICIENSYSADGSFAAPTPPYQSTHLASTFYSQGANNIQDSDRKKVVTVPRIQSMKDYILKHYKRLILSEINRQIDQGTLRSIQEACAEPVKINVSNCTFREITFWRCDTHQLLAEVAIDTAVATGHGRLCEELYCELLISMKATTTVVCGECGFRRDQPERNLWKLSHYLVPILRKDEVEKGAEALLMKHCPHALEAPNEHSAYLLARRMGLRVESLPLYHQTGTLSMLFFCDGNLLVDQDDDETPRCATVSANTIVINTNAVHKDCCQLEIYHECIHYDWHAMFFRLQDMHHSDLRKMQTKRIIVTGDKVPANPLYWMEWQARRGSFALMMPLALMKPMITILWNHPARKALHAGKRFDSMIRTIARDHELPKFRVRARLVQMGYVAAKGALNYVDGRYIEPFAFSSSNGEGNHSFVIDRKSLFAIYQESATFRTQISHGAYIYVDGHVCLNSEKYVRQTTNGMRLTPWANAHVDACCLRFISVYESCGIADYCFGAMNSDEAYNRHYMAFAESGNTRTAREHLHAMSTLIAALPASFPEALCYLMTQARTTIEKLEEDAFISNRTISRLRTDRERRDYSLDQVIALHLPPWLSRDMVAKAGFVFRPIRQHQAYQMVLDCLFMDSVNDVQQFLLSTGCEPLRLAGWQADP